MSIALSKSTYIELEQKLLLPNESYYLGEKKANPNLEIEVILTSGSLEMLKIFA